jgi:23S rRNA maturation-related 3'-5' exoribonuclease YhaM
MGKKNGIVDVTIPVELTDAQLREVGRELGGLQQELDSVESQKRASSADFRASIKRIREEMRARSIALTTGKMERTTKARVERKGGQVEYFHPKTGELLHKRAMSPDEAQDELEFDGAEA